MANPTQLEVWLQGFPREETETRIRELEGELATLRNALALHDTFAAKANGTVLTEPTTDTPPNRPEAIRQVLRNRQNEPTAPGVIKDTMIENGWLAGDRRHLKLFYSAMSTMTKRGHLLRLQDGRYMLPPSKMGGDSGA